MCWSLFTCIGLFLCMLVSFVGLFAYKVVSFQKKKLQMFVISHLFICDMFFHMYWFLFICDGPFPYVLVSFHMYWFLFICIGPFLYILVSFHMWWSLFICIHTHMFMCGATPCMNIFMCGCVSLLLYPEIDMKWLIESRNAWIYTNITQTLTWLCMC